MLNIYKTNKVELIAEVLAKELSINPPPITEKLNISVDNYLLSKWIRDQITTFNNISSLYEFQTINKYSDNILKKIFPNSNFSFWNYESLKWQILDSIDDFKKIPEFWPLRKWINKYVENNSSINKDIYYLSTKIAKVFSDYLIYRPELIENWYECNINSKALLNGLKEEYYWQPILFKILQRKIIDKPQCLYMMEVIKNIELFKKNIQESLSSNIYIISINNLSKLQLNFYLKISIYKDIKIFLLSSGHDIWDRINTEEGSYLALDNTKKYQIPKNNIVSTFGRFEGNFYKLVDEILSTQKVNYNIQSPFIDPTINYDSKNKSILNQIQKKIIDNNNNNIDLNKNDDSLIFKGLDNILEELNFIKSQILKLIEFNKDINYSDIAIITTQLKEVKPYLKYIFSADMKIPYFFTQEDQKDISNIYKFVYEIIDLANKKITINELGLLLCDPIAQIIFNYELKEKDEILSILKESGFHWGLDYNERFGEFKNSLDWCIQRISLGLICDEGFYIKDKQLKSFVPKNSTLDLHKWIRILNELKEYINSFKGLKTYSQWTNNIVKILTHFKRINNNYSEEINIINKIIKDYSKNINCKIEIDINVLKEVLNTCFNNRNKNLDIHRNEVLISDLNHGRLIPHKIIFLIDMNDIFYPKKFKKENINLLNKNYSLGDPSPINKELNLFLELLMSCRRQLIITWVNFDDKNNKLEVSAPIREFIEYLKYNLNGSVQKYLFNSSELKNEDEDKIKLINNRNEQSKKNLYGLIKKIEWSDESYSDNTYKLSELIYWFSAPQLYWLNKKNIYPIKRFEHNANDEVISNFQKFKLINNIFKNINIDQINIKNIFDQLDIEEEVIASGIIAPQNSLNIKKEEINELIESLLSNLKQFKSFKTEYIKSDSNKEEYILSKDEIIEIFHSDLNLSKRLESWIRLLFISSIKKEIRKTNIIYRKDNKYKIEILNSPNFSTSRKILFKYINFYKTSFKYCLPIPPKSSFKYVQAIIKDKDANKAFKDEWLGNKSFYEGERSQAEMRICFGYERDHEFFLNNNTFKKLSIDLYKPLIEASKS